MSLSATAAVNISKMIELPEEASVEQIREFFHHMNKRQREAVKDVDINVPSPAGFDGPMSLSAFLSRVTKTGHDIYVGNEILPGLPSKTSEITCPEMDNKFFVDKFAAPNPTYAKYTDPELYASKKGRMVFLIDLGTAMTEMKSFSEVVACRLLDMLHDPVYSHTLSFVLHRTLMGFLKSEGSLGKRANNTTKGPSKATYFNTTGVFTPPGVQIKKPYSISGEKKRTSSTTDEIINGKLANGEALPRKICLPITFVTSDMVRFPEGVDADEKDAAQKMNALVSTIISLCGVDLMYACAVENKETGVVKYGGGFAVRGCHHHNPDSGCAYATPGTSFDPETKCRCGEGKTAYLHYDPEMCGAALAECDCNMTPTTVASRFCNTVIRESRHLPLPLDRLDADVPDRLRGKPFGSFNNVSLSAEERRKHIVSYALSPRLRQGTGFFNKMASVSPLFGDITPPCAALLHEQNAKGLVLTDETVALVLLNSMPHGANYDIEMKACVIKSGFGYSVKFEIHVLIANGIAVGHGSKIEDEGDSFDDTPVVPQRKTEQSTPFVRPVPRVAESCEDEIPLDATALSILDEDDL